VRSQRSDFCRDFIVIGRRHSPVAIGPQIFGGEKEKQPASPTLPALTSLPSIICVAPIACAQSSIIFRLYFRATSLIGAISAIWPKRCTGITAFILLSLPSLLSESSLTSKEAGSRLKVLGSISTKTAWRQPPRLPRQWQKR